MLKLAAFFACSGIAFAQFTPPPATGVPSGSAGGDLSGTYPNPTVAKLNGVAAANFVQACSGVWQLAPSSASGTAYSGTPTLLDGSAIPASCLSSPNPRQQLIFTPDLNNTGAATLSIDGSTNINIKKGYAINSSGTLAANDLAASRVYTFALNTAKTAWFIQGPGNIVNNDGSILLTGSMASIVASQGPSVSFASTTNCSDNGSPAVCSAAPTGAVAIPTGVTSVALTVNTTAVTANSGIHVQSDDSLTVPSTTCNSTLATIALNPVVTARTPGVSFTITYNGTIATNKLCVHYWIVN